MKGNGDKFKEFFQGKLFKFRKCLNEKALPIEISKEQEDDLIKNIWMIDPYNNHILECKWNIEKEMRKDLSDLVKDIDDEDFTRKMVNNVFNIDMLFYKELEKIIQEYESSNIQKIKIIAKTK